MLLDVRRDWRSKISKGHADQRADDGRVNPETIEHLISTKRKTKKAGIWPLTCVPASLECTPTIKQLSHRVRNMGFIRLFYTD